jgi:hypothetical protein
MYAEPSASVQLCRYAAHACMYAEYAVHIQVCSVWAHEQICRIWNPHVCMLSTGPRAGMLIIGVHLHCASTLPYIEYIEGDMHVQRYYTIC